MPTPPNWEAAVDGVPGNLNATNHAAELTQFLGTHSPNFLYTGNNILSPDGGPNFTWLSLGNTVDFSQPFTMPGGHSAIGRVTLPINTVGNGADLFVGLYADNGSNAPDITNLLSASVVPAAHINALSATSGLSSGGPLAAARFNANGCTGGDNFFAWAPPASFGGGGALNSCTAASGNFIITAGGDDGSGNPLGAVATTEFLGGTSVALAQAQPAIPQPADMAGITVVGTNVMFAGGSAVSGVTTNVWVASWDVQAGQIGNWSLQTALPQGVYRHGMAAKGNTVYVVGGQITGSTVVSNVYFNTLNNGQTGTWQTGPSLPVALSAMACTVIGNWLIVAGGNTSSVSFPTPSTGLYYARINSADGSLDYWRTGPSVPVAYATENGGWSMGISDGVLNLFMGLTTASFINQNQSISFDDNGPSDQWFSTKLPHATITQCGAMALGFGNYQLISLNFPNSDYDTTQLIPVPLISVPLLATGLTGGSKYHIVLQQQGSASASDYLQFGVSSAALSFDAIKSNRHSGSWSAALTGSSMPLTLFDNATGTGAPLHTWEDPTATGSNYTSNLASRTSTILTNRHGVIYGLCESTLLPNDPLNINPTFTSGVANWTPSGCTFTQSSAQTHGGFSFSGLMTPNTTTNPSVTSELERIIAVAPLFNNSQWYTVNGWFYSVTGWGTFNLNINWYTSTQTLISTSSSVTSLAANTWKNVVNTFQPPSNAFYASIGIVQTGSTTNANLLYCSNVTLSSSIELTKSFATVSEVTSSSAGWPPTGITQLA